MQSVINAQVSLWTNTDNQVDEQGNALDGLTLQEKIALSAEMAKGDLPDGANIAKAIVEGYEDGLMIGGAFYLGPAAALEQITAGAVIGGGMNSAFQFYDLSQPGNANKSYDYWSTTAAITTGGLAPGRGIWANTGIAIGSTMFTDGPNITNMAISGVGALGGGGVGKYAPILVDKYIKKVAVPDLFYDLGSALTYESINKAGKDLIKSKENEK
ncbi:adhesin [Chimaeribacter californicus]|uniref:Adhesin n=1 Tax=Chimaeribacter californicus TaxID=2060067 RepID=A0A2N5EEA9_9GAMM|nr:adhesin [Chimaeribacter californicus]PLR40868.1 adhesin [Chimaeribacter californicus]